MPNITKPIEIWKYRLNTPFLLSNTQSVINEETLELRVNGEPWLNFVCTPSNVEALVIGFLYNEGIIYTLDEINKINLIGNSIDVSIREFKNRPRLFTRTSTGISVNKDSIKPIIENHYQKSAIGLINLYNLFLENQQYHKDVGGFHGAALSDGDQLNIKFEDIGRHNCIDKICGQFLLSSRPFKPQMVLLTGRISSEMVYKITKLEVPIIISRTTPTAHAVEIAIDRGICIVGYLRKDNFSIYSHPERITVS